MVKLFKDRSCIYYLFCLKEPAKGRDSREPVRGRGQDGGLDREGGGEGGEKEIY